MWESFKLIKIVWVCLRLQPPSCGIWKKQGGDRATWHRRADRCSCSSVVKAALPVVWSWNWLHRVSQSILVGFFYFFLFGPTFLSFSDHCPSCPKTSHRTHTRMQPPPPPSGSLLAINETALTVAVSWPLDRATAEPRPAAFRFPPPCWTPSLTTSHIHPDLFQPQPHSQNCRSHKSMTLLCKGTCGAGSFMLSPAKSWWCSYVAINLETQGHIVCV